MEVHLYWAVGEEWGDGEEIFAATSEEQAVQELVCSAPGRQPREAESRCRAVHRLPVDGV